MSMVYNNTLTTGTGFTVSASGSDTPRTPSGLIVTRAIETKAGWVGQILVDKEITYETTAKEDNADALEEVNKRVVARIRKLFA